MSIIISRRLYLGIAVVAAFVVGAVALEVDPASLSAVVAADGSSTQDVTVTNNGSMSVDVEVSIRMKSSSSNATAARRLRNRSVLERHLESKRTVRPRRLSSWGRVVDKAWTDVKTPGVGTLIEKMSTETQQFATRQEAVAAAKAKIEAAAVKTSSSSSPSSSEATSTATTLLRPSTSAAALPVDPKKIQEVKPLSSPAVSLTSASASASKTPTATATASVAATAKKKLCKGNITKVLMQLKPDAVADGGSTLRRRLTADEDLGVKAWKHMPKVNVDVAEVDCEASEDAAEVTLKAIKAKYGDSLMFAELDQVVKPIGSKGKLLPLPPSSAPLRQAAQAEVDDEYWSSMWDQQYLNMPEAWTQLSSINKDPSEVLIAVIDTGVQIDHPDLVNNIWTNPNEIADNGIDDDGNGYIDDVHGWDFTADSATMIDEDGHGTHCSGSIAAEGNNGIGIVGVAGMSANVKIVPLRTISPTSGSVSDAINAFDYCITMGIMVSSNSWAIDGYSEALAVALDRANDAGHVVVTAASNEGQNNEEVDVYPCNWASENIICVASITSADALSDFSNYGAVSVDIAAPGSDIPSTYITDSYAYLSGTSMATPHVAGAVALMLSNFDYLTAMEVGELILSTAVAKDYLNGVVSTGGVMDVSALVNGALNKAWLSILSSDGNERSLSLTLASSASATLSVAMEGSGLPAGLHEASVVFSVAGTETNLPVSFTIAGSPVLSVLSNSTLDFGDVSTGLKASMKIVVANSGDGLLRLVAETPSSPFLGPSEEMEAGEGENISIAFGCKPSAEGTYTETVLIKTNGGTGFPDSADADATDSGSSFEVTLTCVGKAPPNLQLTAWSGIGIYDSGSSGDMTYLDPCVPAGWEHALGSGNVEAQIILDTSGGCTTPTDSAVSGSILLVTEYRFYCSYRDQANYAAQAGAVGVIFANVYGSSLPSPVFEDTQTSSATPTIPAFLISYSAGQSLKDRVAAESVYAHVNHVPVTAVDGVANVSISNTGQAAFNWNATLMLASNVSQSDFYTAIYPGSGGDEEDPETFWSTNLQEMEDFRLGLMDDAGGWIDLPGGVSFFGTVYHQVGISTNGILTFDTSHTPGADYSGTMLSSAAPNGFIAPLWADMKCSSATRISAGQVDTNETGGVIAYAVQFQDIAFYDESGTDSTSSYDVSFEVRIYETGEIKFSYKDFADALGYMSVFGVGVEDMSGTHGLNLVSDLPFASGQAFAVTLKAWSRPETQTDGTLAAQASVDIVYSLNPVKAAVAWVEVTAEDCTGLWMASRLVRVVVEGLTLSWQAGEWGSCEAYGCSEGRRSRNVTCVDNSGNVYSNSDCPAAEDTSDCSDESTWKDSDGYSCQDYADYGWCVDGGYGSSWSSNWGTFEDWATNGVSANDACCECGGGTSNSGSNDDEKPSVYESCDDYTPNEDCTTTTTSATTTSTLTGNLLLPFDVSPTSVSVSIQEGSVGEDRTLTITNPWGSDATVTISVAGMAYNSSNRRLQEERTTVARRTTSKFLNARSSSSRSSRTATSSASDQAARVALAQDLKKASALKQRNQQAAMEAAATATPQASSTCDGPSRLLMRLKKSADAEQHRRLKADEVVGVTSWKSLSRVGIEIAQIDCAAAGTSAAALEHVKATYGESLDFVELDQKVKPLSGLANDPYSSYQWALDNMNVEEAWERVSGRSSSRSKIVVAVIDTGVQVDHPDLAANIWTNTGEIEGNGIDDDGNGFIDDVHGYDFHEYDGSPDDTSGHGTHCAGVIAAVSNNNVGMAGIAGGSSVADVEIMAIQVMDDDGGSLSAIIEGLDYALAQGASISSNSYGYSDYSYSVEAAISAAHEVGHLFIVAAGNDGNDHNVVGGYPCDYQLDNVICVGSIGQGSSQSYFSDYGQGFVHIAAPGENILSTYPTNAYQYLDGTSMATPQVSGAIALVMSNYPYLKPQEVKMAVLESSANQTGNDWIDYGILDVAAFVEQARGSSWLSYQTESNEYVEFTSVDLSLSAEESKEVYLRIGGASLPAGNHFASLLVSWSGDGMPGAASVPVSCSVEGTPAISFSINTDMTDTGDSWEGSTTVGGEVLRFRAVLKNRGSETLRVKPLQGFFQSPPWTLEVAGEETEGGDEISVAVGRSIPIDAFCDPTSAGTFTSKLVLRSNAGLPASQGGSLSTEHNFTLVCVVEPPPKLVVANFTGIAATTGGGAVVPTGLAAPAEWNSALPGSTLNATLAVLDSTGCSSNSLYGYTLSGKIAILNETMECDIAVQASTLSAAGAVGFLVYGNDRRFEWGSSDVVIPAPARASSTASSNLPSIPTFYLDNSTAERLLTLAGDTAAEEEEVYVAMYWPTLLAGVPAVDTLVAIKVENHGDSPFNFTVGASPAFGGKSMDDYYIFEGPLEDDIPWTDTFTDLEELYSLRSVDDYMVWVDLPFTFPFYSDKYDSLKVCSNGWIGFNVDMMWEDTLLSWNADSGPNNLLAPLGADLMTDSTSRVYAGEIATEGETPRIFSVQWNNMLFYGDYTYSRVSFEARLYEDGSVDFIYANYTGYNSDFQRMIGVIGEDGVSNASLPSLGFQTGQPPLMFELSPWIIAQNYSMTAGVLEAGGSAVIEFLVPAGTETQGLVLVVAETESGGLASSAVLNLGWATSGICQYTLGEWSECSVSNCSTATGYQDRAKNCLSVSDSSTCEEKFCDSTWLADSSGELPNLTQSCWAAACDTSTTMLRDVENTTSTTAYPESSSSTAAAVEEAEATTTTPAPTTTAEEATTTTVWVTLEPGETSTTKTKSTTTKTTTTTTTLESSAVSVVETIESSLVLSEEPDQDMQDACQTGIADTLDVDEDQVEMQGVEQETGRRLAGGWVIKYQVTFETVQDGSESSGSTGASSATSALAKLQTLATDAADLVSAISTALESKGISAPSLSITASEPDPIVTKQVAWVGTPWEACVASDQESVVCGEPFAGTQSRSVWCADIATGVAVTVDNSLCASITTLASSQSCTDTEECGETSTTALPSTTMPANDDDDNASTTTMNDGGDDDGDDDIPMDSTLSASTSVAVTLAALCASMPVIAQLQL